MKRADLLGPCPLLDSYLKTKDPQTSKYLGDIMDLMPRRGELVQEFKKYEMKKKHQLRRSIQDYIGDIHQFWAIEKIDLPPPEGKPSSFASLGTTIQEILKEEAKVWTWYHPGVLMAGDLLAVLEKKDKNCLKVDLTVKTHILFAMDGMAPSGIHGKLIMERIPNGCGVLVPHAQFTAYLKLNNSFTDAMLKAWNAAKKFLQAKEKAWNVEEKNSDGKLSYDWRWRIEFPEAAKRSLDSRQLVELKDYSGQAAIACALIASAEHNPDNSTGVDPLDPYVAISATINADDMKLGKVGALNIKTLTESRVFQIIVSKKPNENPDNRVEFLEADDLEEAYMLMTQFPRITRGVNKEIVAEIEKLSSAHIQNYIEPAIADSNEWDKERRNKPGKYATYPPPGSEKTSEWFDKEFLQIDSSGSDLEGSRVFLEGDSGLGKSTFLLHKQHYIAKNHSSDFIPIRFGRTLANDEALSEIDWPQMNASKLLECRQLNDFINRYNKSLGSANFTKLSDQDLMNWIQWMQEHGRIVWLLDALDQTNSNDRLVMLGPTLSGKSWRRCPVMLTGRSYATTEKVDATNGAPWIYLRMVPFDKNRWTKYLSDSTELADLAYIDEAILSVPLLLWMIKGTEFKKRIDDSKEIKMNTKDIYELSINQLIRKNNPHIDVINPKKALSEIAWFMYQDSRFRNELNDERYSEIKPFFGKDRDLHHLLVSNIISNQWFDKDREGLGLAFRHRSFLEYFLAYFLSFTFQPDQQPDLFLKPFVDRYRTEKEIEDILKDVSANNSDTGPLAWDETLRFLLCMIKDKTKRDWFANFLIDIGRNVVVARALDLDKLELEENIRTRSKNLDESPGKSEA